MGCVEHSLTPSLPEIHHTMDSSQPPDSSLLSPVTLHYTEVKEDTVSSSLLDTHWPFYLLLVFVCLALVACLIQATTCLYIVITRQRRPAIATQTQTVWDIMLLLLLLSLLLLLCCPLNGP